MLNPFPSLLVYTAFAPFILRLVVSLWFLNHSSKSFKNKGYPLYLSILEFVGGIFLLVGLYTQIAVIILMVVIFIRNFRNRNVQESIDSRTIRFLILVILITILITGAGVFAFDIPL